jgi:hypothetical protein
MVSVCPIVLIASLMSTLAVELDKGLDWESFEAALIEDGEEEAISLLQTSAIVLKAFGHASSVKGLHDAYRPAEVPEESYGKLGEITPDAFADAIEAEETPHSAVALIQTGAHIERRVGADRVAVATEADGSNVLMGSDAPTSHDGVMHMSVDANGKFHWESDDAGISLLQKDAGLKIASGPQDELNAAPIEDSHKSSVDAKKPIQELSDVSQDAIAAALAAEDKESSGSLSLLQTDAHVVMVTEADGSNVASKLQKPAKHDGIVQISVDGGGHFHFEEDAGLSLMQEEASLKVASHRTVDDQLEDSAKVSLKPNESLDMPKESSAATGAAEQEEPAVSLMQTESHMVVATDADGSNVVVSPGMLQHHDHIAMSIGADGRFHWEEDEDKVGVSLLQKQSKLQVVSVDSPDSATPRETAHPQQKSTDKNDIKYQEEPAVTMPDIPHEAFAQKLSSELTGVEGLSLVQTGARVERTTVVTDADGSNTIDVARPKPHNGVMHISVNANGKFHWEI